MQSPDHVLCVGADHTCSASQTLSQRARYGRPPNGPRRGGSGTVWVTVLVSVLGETVTVLGGTVVVGVSVLGGGAVSVTVWVGAPPPPRWREGSAAVVVTNGRRHHGSGDSGGSGGWGAPVVITAISSGLGRLGVVV